MGNLATVPSAQGAEAGALFVYALPEALDLRAHGSALLPFMDSKVEARPVTWFDGASDKARSALRVVNSTAQTLPAGTIAFFESGGFAGESGLDRLKPGERRFVTYGFDLDVELTQKRSSSVEEPQRVLFDDKKARLEEHYLKNTDDAYLLENRSASPRTLVVGTKLGSNAKVLGVDEVDFDSVSGRPLLVFNVPALKNAERTTHIVEGLVRYTALSALTSEGLLALANAATVPAADRAAATAAALRLRDAEASDKALAKADAELAELKHDIDRLREHMKALADHPGAGQNPFATRVLSAEDKLTALRAKREEIQKRATSQRDAARGELGKLVLGSPTL